MRQIVRTVAPALAASAMLMSATYAEALEKERGNIVSTDWRKMEIELKSPKGRVKTWRVARDCEVKFTDKKDEFPNPKLSDLRPPMYVHFLIEPSTEVIQSIEVVEVGFEPSRGGPGAQQQGVVTNLNVERGHLEVNLGAGPQTFEVDPKDQLRAFRIGDKVTVLIENRDGRDVITRITREDAKGAVQGPRRQQQGVITSLSVERGHLEVNLGAGPQTFEVDPKDQLRAFRIGDKVTVLIENRDGRDVITRITREDARGAVQRFRKP